MACVDRCIEQKLLTYPSYPSISVPNVITTVATSIFKKEYALLAEKQSELIKRNKEDLSCGLASLGASITCLSLGFIPCIIKTIPPMQAISPVGAFLFSAYGIFATFRSASLSLGPCVQINSSEEDTLTCTSKTLNTPLHKIDYSMQLLKQIEENEDEQGTVKKINDPYLTHALQQPGPLSKIDIAKNYIAQLNKEL